MNTKSWPVYSQEEIDAVSAILASGKVNYWTGSECREFEKEFSSYCNSKYAVALSNGTVALELALRSLGIQNGDEVIVTSRSFIASVSAIVMVGAIPVFADVDIDSQNITPETVENVITPKTKAILAVHLAGWPCEMDGLMDLASKYDLKVLEDCAQAHGAMYKGRPVGSIGHVAAWSFCQDKIISTGGEGGMLTTNNENIWRKAWEYKDHGKSWSAVRSADHQPGFRWLHESFGTNWRMTEMQAAIGRVQLRNLPKWSDMRLSHAQNIWDAVKGVAGLRVPVIPQHIQHAAYKCYIFVDHEVSCLKWGRDRIMKEINKLEVPCLSGSCSEIYLEKAFDDTNMRPEKRLPAAKLLGETSLMFMVHPTLTNEDIQQTINAIRKVFSKALI